MKPSKSAYQGDIFNIEFYVAVDGTSPAEDWLESQPMKAQQKFAALFGRFVHFSAANRIRAVVVLHVEMAAPLVSPAYDTGGIEHEIRRNWRDYFESIQPKG